MDYTPWTPNQFREWRKRMGWTQTEAAAHLGSRKEYVSQIERGVANPSETLQRLCMALEKLTFSEK